MFTTAHQILKLGCVTLRSPLVTCGLQVICRIHWQDPRRRRRKGGDYEPPPRGVNHWYPPPPPLLSAVPSDRPGRRDDLPVFLTHAGRFATRAGRGLGLRSRRGGRLPTTRACAARHMLSLRSRDVKMSPGELHSLLSHWSSTRAYAPSCSLPNRLAMTSRFGEAQRSATEKVAHSQSRALGICSRFARAGHSESLQKQIAL